MPTLAREATRERAASDIAIQVVSRVVNLAMGVVVTALVVRTLHAVGYGQWSTLLVVTSLLGYFATFGMEGAALREAARHPEQEFEWLGAVIALRFMLLVPLLLAAVGTVFALSESHQMLVSGLILCCAMPFGGVATISVLFQLRVDNRIPMLIMTLRSIVWGVAVLLIYLNHGTMVALAIAMVVSGVATNALQALLALRVVGRWPRPSRKRLGALVRIGIPMGVSGVLIISYAKIDQIFVFTISGARQAGLYGAVYNMLDQAHFVPLSILTTLNPVLAAAWPHDRERLLRAARMTAELLAIASFGALAFVIVGGEEILRLIFGPSFAQAAPALAVLGGAYVLISFGYLNGNLLITAGQQKRLLRISLVALVVNLVGNAILVPVVGYIGAAVMTLITEAVVFGMAAYWILHTLDVPRPGFGRIARTALAALILGLVLGAQRLAGAGLAVLIPTACILYPALLYWLGAFTLDDVRTIMRRGRTV